MSRIGKLPIPVPKGVTIAIDGNTVKVKGPKGELARTFAGGITIGQEGETINVRRASDEENHKALHGLSRTLLANMVEGVTKGYQKTLEISGVGYKAEVKPFGLQRPRLLASDPVQGAGGREAQRAAADDDRHRRRRQGEGGTGGGRAAQPASARALQGQGHQVSG
jgi:hypothetical protein